MSRWRACGSDRVFVAINMYFIYYILYTYIFYIHISHLLNAEKGQLIGMFCHNPLITSDN